jgi:hypothetical protein
MKTSLSATIRIESRAWERVRRIAAKGHRPLSEVIGELLERATAEPEPAAPIPYQVPPLTSAFVSPHPDTLPPKRSG